MSGHHNHNQVHGQRLLNQEIDERFVLKLDKTIKKEGVNGIMMFGENNDYPKIIEKLINGSNSAKSVANIYAKFLTGKGFENESINNIIVGTDSRGKEITTKSLLRQVANSVSYHNGFYVHRNVNLAGETGTVHMKAFKDCRFSNADDLGYSAKIAVYDNWLKDSQMKKYDKTLIKDFNVFNPNLDVILEQIEKAGGITKYKGQIYFQFFDDQYFYPLSNFDTVYLDCDTENQLSLHKNRQTRNGFLKKIILRLAPMGTDAERNEMVASVRKQLGVNGDTFLILEDEFDPETGEMTKNGAYSYDTIDTNIDDKLFENWEKGLSNNIRKIGGKGVPAILIDYEEGKLSTTSGESIIQATNYYNAITNDDRALISNSFKEIFRNSAIPELKANTNWNIVPLALIQPVQNGTTDTSTTTNI